LKRQSNTDLIETMIEYLFNYSSSSKFSSAQTLTFGRPFGFSRLVS